MKGFGNRSQISGYGINERGTVAVQDQGLFDSGGNDEDELEIELTEEEFHYAVEMTE